MSESRRRNSRSTRNRPTDDELLDAARAVIAEHGADNSTMDMIARRGSTSRVTLYAHFGSRDDLVAKVIDRELDAFTTWMITAYDDSESIAYGARARYAVTSMFDYARRNPEGFRLLLGHRRGTETPGRRMHEVLEPRVASRLRQNYAERGADIGPSADTLASVLLGICRHVAHQAIIVEGADIDIACELAVAATTAVLRDVGPDLLLSLDRSLQDADPTG